MGPETEKRAPGAFNFKKNIWRPFAAAIAVAAVYNDTPNSINQQLFLNQGHESKVSYQDLENTSFTSSPMIQDLPAPEVDPHITTHEQPDSKSKDLGIIIAQMSARSDLFDNRLIEDVSVYYPIYKSIGDHYDIKWYLLWILHEGESSASANPDAFNGKSGHIGGFQRSPEWAQLTVDKAAQGLEHLAQLPQRHPTDWQESAFAAWHLTEVKKDNTILGSLLAYSSQVSAYSRYRLYQIYQRIFD